jgi:hypothetical protein
MLHLMKLAVGVCDLEHLRTLQAARAAAGMPLGHRTRNMPRRAAEITEGGSIYWVIGGAMLTRQRVLAIEEETGEAGRHARLVLDPALVPVAARPVKPFQGWRYLAAEAAPPDLAAAAPAEGIAGLPPALRRELQALGLL